MRKTKVCLHEMRKISGDIVFAIYGYKAGCRPHGAANILLFFAMHWRSIAESRQIQGLDCRSGIGHGKELLM